MSGTPEAMRRLLQARNVDTVSAAAVVSAAGAEASRPFAIQVTARTTGRPAVRTKWRT